MPLIDYEALVNSLSPSDMRNVLLVDCHLADELDWENSTTNWSFRAVTHFFTGSSASSNFKQLMYTFAGWQVIMVWPAGWQPPAPNRLGWLPKGEFGATNRYYNDLNPDLEYPVPAFQYMDITGNLCIPPGPVIGA